ncbi:MAG: (2Fe-2S)-binding protein [Oscillospiraceae bacterium]|nr:(2Fe-2S)-binding protein [Oscillospiraceae bacterium]
MSGNVNPAMTLTAETASERVTALIDGIPSSLTQYRCPICGGIFTGYADLKSHYAAAHGDSPAPVVAALTLNGRRCEVLIEPHWTLKRTLQFRLGLTGTKHMCDKGVCGSCTVIMDGRAVLSCQMLAVECEGKDIQTIEGIAADPKWRPLIDAYCRWDAMQCGYCTTGFLVSAKALLDKNPNPTELECREALAGNICICGTYPRHAQAIIEAAMKMSEGCRI